MGKIRYFDHAATTCVNEEVIKTMIPFFGINYGNASSLYSIGRKAKRELEKSREQVADILGAKAKEIYFTGCGSESDNLAIKGVAYANRKKGNHIITTKIEHPAVLNTCKALEKEGFEVTYLGVDENGIISVKELENAITPKTILISVMFANNEIGTIQPIKEIGLIARKRKIPFHTDAVQAVGNVKIDVNEMNIDLLSLSAHKFYGPKGVGALFVRKNIEFEKVQDGGHQERNKRSGTENLPGIVGLAKAMQISYNKLESYNKKLTELRDYYISEVEKNIPHIKVNGDRKRRLPGNANISFGFVEGEDLLLNLDKEGICASSGSACTSGSAEPSHVLVAIRVPSEIAYGSLRVTFGEENTKEDVDFLVKSLIEIVGRLRNMSQEYKEFIQK